MELGIPQDAKLSWVLPSRELPIVVYGTSIAQGGCASRPGMAWTGILNRELPYPLINLAFSGNGMLEKEVLNFINEIDAKLYILDCLPNLVGKPAPFIETATIEAVRQIRTLHQTPILLVEHPGYCDAFVDKTKFESCNRANMASKAAFKQLKAEGVSNIFYLTYEEINMPMDGTVDGIHSTDYGMRVYADAYNKVIRKILSK
jgi:lysophospholipase L1-like esterase